MNDKIEDGTFTDTEQDELDELVKRVDGHMLLRSKALLLLKERGHAIEDYLSAAL
ncbi:MAG: hypothetical protein SF029_26055 [bacterium]|nr:hypothetical protein [bacterium]